MMSFRAFTGMFGAALAIASAGVAAPASAQSNRTWVSGLGDDANPCSRTLPCKTFIGAIAKTNPEGEINCLDPGNYGIFGISQSITIDCAGTNGAVVSAGNNAIIIDAPGIVVTLRNLNISGTNAATGNGIRILQGAVVNIDNVVIENFGGTGNFGRGISIETSTPGVRVSVVNSRFHRLNSNAIDSVPSAGNVFLTVDNCSISNGGLNGIRLLRNTQATISNNVITGQFSAAGVLTEQSGVLAHLFNNVIANNVIGINNGNGGSPYTIIAGNSIFGNTLQGMSINSGAIVSQGNNAITGNSGNQNPSSTSQPLR